MPNEGMADDNNNNHNHHDGMPGFQDIPVSLLHSADTMAVDRLDRAVNHLNRQHPDISATNPKQILAVELLVFSFFTLFASYLLFPVHASIAVACACLIMVLNETVCLSRHGPKNPAPVEVSDKKLPTYTILLPLFKEANMVTQLISAMAHLNYPPDRLEIFFITEEEDHDTLAAIRAGLASGPIEAKAEVIIVPKGHPQTKPRACNYALTFATGSLIVIYDAEDMPHPDQLREAGGIFATHPDDKICLQAPLIVQDRNYDWLGLLMAVNYTTQFNLQMPVNASIGLPVFFGGTSNHMRLRDLADAGGWDAFNVTEDAELSLRMVKRGFTINMLALPTFETATRGLKNHFTQRCRWQKGSFQTLVAHYGSMSRSALNPVQVAHVALTLVNRIISPLFYMLLLLSMVMTQVSPLDPTNFSGRVIIFCLAMLIILNLVACFRQQRFGLIFALPLLPFHWLFLSLTFIFALVQLMTKPSYWNKTPHTRFAGGLIPPNRGDGR